MMNAKEICKILEACSKTGVTQLSLGELVIHFAPPTPVANQATTDQSFIEFPTGKQPMAANDFSRDEQLMKEEQMDLMLIENPVKFEQLHAAGDLEDGQTASN